MAIDTARLPFWRRLFAGIFDFITIFGVGGWAIAKLTGGTTSDGFSLNGAPALALFVLIVAYFIVGNRYFGGTLWKHILAKRVA